MSRSRKKTPGFTDQQRGTAGTWFKRYANRVFRRYSGPVQNGKWYRKHFDPWSICDWKMLCYTRAEVDEWVRNGWDERYRIYMK